MKPQCILLAGAMFGFVLNTGAAEPPITAKDLPRVSARGPDQALGTLRVKPGFQLELAAAEPLVVDPVAMSFDENGRLFVVEMRDYSERRDEHLGTIRLLEDTDGDGRFDKSTVYADNLAWPTAVICYGGGVYVGATPDILYLKDTNSDGVADVREVVFTGFGAGVERLNVQALLNSFNWGLDNRIHGATSLNGARVVSTKNPGAKPLELRGHDFSFDPRTLEIRSESGGGQHGLSFDDHGRKFVCSNSAHIQTLMYGDGDAGRNPFFSMPSPLVTIAVDGPAAEVYRISPDEPWRVIRTKWRVSGLVPGPIEGGGRPSGYFTGATGVTIYRGNAWPAEYRGDAFVADCGSNLIHRKKLLPEGVGLLAKRPDDELKSEFVVSTDNWFRPVQFANAPDGTLYVADMYREVIEHPWSLPPGIKQYLDLNSGNDRGRIYRIVPIGFQQPKPPHLGAATTSELVKTLEHENGWHRDAAARLLYERQDRSAVPALEELAARSRSPLGRLHALGALQGLGALTLEFLYTKLADADPGVREHAVRLSTRFLESRSEFPVNLWAKLQSMAADDNARVRYQLAFTLGAARGAARNLALSVIARRGLEDIWVRSAVLNSLTDGAGEVFGFLATSPQAASNLEANPVWDSAPGQEFLGQLLRIIGAQHHSNEISEALISLSKLKNVGLTFKLASALVEGMKRGGPGSAVLGSEAEGTLQTIYRQAGEAARDSSAMESRRVAAAQLLRSLTWTEARSSLLPMLDRTQPQLVQQAAIRALAQFREAQPGAELIQRWPSFTPQVRGEVLTALLGRPDKTLALLAALEGNVIQRSDLSSTQTKFLSSHRDAVIRERAAKLFTPAQSALREEVVKQFLPALDLKGDAVRGKKFYLERCLSCHRQGNEGHAVGPDFTSVQSSGKEKLLINLIDPNREVPPNYLNYIVETQDGESLMGLVANENATSVTLRRAFGDETVVPRSSIRRLQSSNLSVMPEGLEAAMSQQDMADLLEFVVSGNAAK
jgi:putative membrane-bound dehydrogenase-like protein